MKTSNGWVIFMFSSEPSTMPMGLVGQVLEDHPAVVCCMEVWIPSGELVRLADQGKPKALRRLRAPEPEPVRDVGDHPVVDDQNGVGRRDSNADGTISAQRVDRVRDDPSAKRAGGPRHGAGCCTPRCPGAAIAMRVLSLRMGPPARTCETLR